MMMSPLPSINEAYALLVDHESQRSFATYQQSMLITEGIESTTLYSNRGNGDSGGNYKFKKSQIQCEYCHYKGHTKENCYKLIGYPPDFKTKKKGSTTSALYANGASGVDFVVGATTHSSEPKSSPSTIENSSFFSSSSLWHKRLGNAPVNIIKRLNVISDVKDCSTKHCLICILAKQSKLPFPLSNSTTKSVFELAHYDIWGPYRVPTYDGKIFFVTLVDDYSRYTWIFLINSKSEVIVVLRDFLVKVKNMFSTNVKYLRTDNGNEFFSNEFTSLVTTLGIMHQSSYVYTPQQNGVVERKHRTILEMASDNSVHPLAAPQSVIQPSPVTSTDGNEDDHCHIPNTTEISTTNEDHVVDPLSSHELRKSSRTSRPPLWLQDYVVH
ncbi:uncharacterized protein [Nicotiana sylvestris]|uniref:uncharacterized protein n=1 Tax=Nicotiana sylvestris TaxID=4096 RepID=UPI00388C74F1